MFLKLQIVLGLDYGYFNFKSFQTKFIVKLACALFSLALSILLLNYFDKSITAVFIIWYGLYIIQYLVYVLIFLTRPPHLTMFKFQSALKVIDSKLNSQSVYRIVEQRKMWAYLLILAFRFSIIMFYCLLYDLCLRPQWLSVCYTLIMSCMDTAITTYTFLFHSVYNRLVVLISKLRQPNYDCVYFQRVYKQIVDVTEEFRGAYDLLLVMALICYVPEVMFVIFYVVLDMIQSKESSAWMLPFRLEIFVVLAELTIALSPAVVAGTLYKQANKIRFILHDKLLFEKDEMKCYEIERFIRYVEDRPLKFNIYEVIPLNTKLLVMVFNFCVTYLIVILQFTHLY